MLTSAPETMKRNAPARRIGQYDGGGMWMDEVSTCAGGVTLRGGVPWPSPYFCTQKSSRSCTVGTTAKLYTGGGEGIVHSSVRPSHGSAGGGGPGRGGVIRLGRATGREEARVGAPTAAAT